MNIFETLAAGTARMEKSARKIVDSTSGKPGVRERLEYEIAVLFDAAAQTRQDQFFPVIAARNPNASVLGEEYKRRADSIRDRIRELRELPKDNTGAYQSVAEMLYGEILDLDKCETHELVRATRDILPPEEAEEIGARAREQENILISSRMG